MNENQILVLIVFVVFVALGHIANLYIDIYETMKKKKAKEKEDKKVKFLREISGTYLDIRRKNGRFKK